MRAGRAVDRRTARWDRRLAGGRRSDPRAGTGMVRGIFVFERKNR